MSAPAPRKLHNIAPRVFGPAAVLIAAFVLVAAVAPGWLKKLLGDANAGVINALGWYYVLIVIGFVAFSFYVAFSPWGDIRLGRDGDQPGYGLFSWFAMLFAAGMGIGLVFWGWPSP